MRVFSFQLYSFIVTAFLTFITCIPSPAVEARGFRIFDQSPTATGQSAAFTAQADDPSAIYYNPAGMSELEGIQVMLGTNLVSGNVHFENEAGMTANGGAPGTVAYPPPSQFYATASLESLIKPLNLNWLENVVIGLGTTSPFGTHIEYPQDGPFSSAVTFASLPLLDIKPTIAFKFSENLSIGIGADIYTFSGLFGEGQFEFQSTLGVPFGPLPAGTKIEINGTDTAVGWNLSLMYTVIRNAESDPLMNFGIVYRSPVDLDLEGDFLANGTRISGASSTLKLPQSITAGIAFWPVRNPTHQWKLELDFDYTWWDTFQNFDVQLSNGGTIPFPQDWKNDKTIMIGTEYKFKRPIWETALRAGYWYSTTPVPDRTFNPAIPDSDEHSISFGAGFLCKKSPKATGFLKFCSNELFPWKAFGVDLAYQVLLVEPRTVRGNINPTVNGRYTNTVHTGAISFTMKF